MSRRLVLVLAALALAVVVLWSAFSNGPGPAGVTARNTAVDLAQATDEGASPLVPVSAEAPGDERTPAVVEDSPPRATAESAREWSGRLHGRLFHARTQAPLAGIQIDYTAPPGVDERMTTDEYGWFVSSQKLAQGTLTLRAVDPITGELLAEKRHEHRPKLIPETLNGEPQLWPLDIGPGFEVDLLGAEGVEGPWKLRVLERPLAVEQRAWEWIDTVPGAKPNQVKARYPPQSGARVRIERGWIEVRNAAETHSGEERLNGSGSFLFRTAVTLGPVRGGIRGRVLDQDGLPVRAAVTAAPLVLVQPDEPLWLASLTAEDGSYSLPGVPPGPTQVFVTADSRRPTRKGIDVYSGRETVLDFELERLGERGDIRGELVVPKQATGPWAILTLSSGDGAPPSRVLEVEAPGTQRKPFVFEGVPLGEYTLEVLALDGRRYEKPIRRVQVPSEEVVFQTDDPSLVQSVEQLVRLRARDELDDRDLEQFSWAVRMGPVWRPQVWQGVAAEAYMETSVRLEDEVIVSAAGYRPEARFLSEVRQTDSGPLLDFALSRGHGTAIIVVDGEQVLGGSEGWAGYGQLLGGLRGADIRVGGRRVATSDLHGIALVASDEPIERFEVVLSGWRVLAVRCADGEERLQDGIGFAVMVRE